MERTYSHSYKYIATLPILALIVTIVILAPLDIKAVFEPPLLLPILNTVFISAISFAVSYISMRSYLASGYLSILMLGCGTLAYGSGNLFAGWLIGVPDGANVSVTIFNIGALVGSIFHFMGSALTLTRVNPELGSNLRKRKVITAYLGVIIFIILITITSLIGIIPPFFIQSVGPTYLRQVVLGTAVVLFTISALIFIRLYFRLKENFLYWYALGLILIATGLFAIFIPNIVGSPISWAGRSAQYLGVIYFLIAILTTIRRARTRKIPLERAIASFFRESEANFRTLVEAANDAIVSFDSEGRILLWNPAAEKIFGYSRGEAVGSPLNDLIIPERYADSLRKEIETLTITGKSTLIGKTTEMVAKRKDGKVIPIEISISARNTAGEWIYIGIIRDITERKRAEEALRKERDRAQKYLDIAGTMIVVMDKNKKIILANKRCCEVLGYEEQEIIGKNWSDTFIPERIRAEVEAVFSRLMAGEIDAVEFFENPVLTRSGEERIIAWHNTVIRDEVGNITGTLSSGEDITERKRAEEALKESEQRFRMVFERSVIGIVLADIEGRILESNPAFEHMLGYSKEELLRKVFMEFTYPDDITHEWAMIQDVIAGKHDYYEIEKRYIRKDGEIIWVRLIGSAVRGRQGEPLYGVALVDDITERKRAENELRKRTEELARSNAELEQFIYIASHDLQEPLRMISIFTQLLERRYKGRLDKDADEFITYIVDGAKHMQQMIEDLLVYSRIGTRGRPFEPTDFEAVFEQAVANLKADIDENKVQVTHDPLPTVMADAPQMVELFQHLISNAIKFRKEEPPRIHISAKREGDEWVFSVRDNGIGISPEFMKRLFKIFQREHAGKYPGTGVGLAICRRIVERHGGRIWAESEPGKGSIFYFTMPMKRD